jgi:hypothetical protein
MKRHIRRLISQLPSTSWALLLLSVLCAGFFAPPVSAQAIVPHDFNSDAKVDLVAQNAAGQIVVWYFDGAIGSQFLGGNWLSQGGVPGWTVVGSADFDGDGHPDLVAQNGSGQIVVWYFAGTQGNAFQGGSFLSQGGASGWNVVAIADFNGDGHPDLVLQDGSGDVIVWYFGGAMGNVFLGWSGLVQGQGVATVWTVVGAADFDGNGRPDLVAENAAGQIVVWYFGGAQGDVFLGGAWLSQIGTTGYTVVGAVDLDGDGHPDLVAQNGSGQIVAWYYGGAGGTTFQTGAFMLASGASGWRAIAR